jgi:predicted nucleic acid-binding protein
VLHETQAKLYIQEMVLNNEVGLAWSYVLKFENSRNIFDFKKKAIAQWERLSSLFIEQSDEIVAMAKKIMTTGVKAADALHVACAIAGNCDYFITVDKRLLKYHDERIIVCNPIEFFNIISC